MVIKLNKNCICLAAAFISITFQSKSQFTINEADIRSKFPNAKHVFLNKEEHLSIELKNQLPLVKVQNLNRGLKLDDNALGYNEEVVSYKYGFEEIEQLEAASYIPDKGSYTKLRVKDIKEYDNIGEGNIFYENIKRRNIIFPAVAKGSVTELAYTTKILDAHFIGGFHFKSYSPVLQSIYSVAVPDGITIGWKFIGDSTDISFSKVKKKNTWVYTWSAHNIDKISNNQNTATYLKYEPHIFVYIRDYENKGKRVPYMGEARDLYNLEYAYIKNINKDVPESALLAVVDSLKRNSSDADKLIAEIFYWAQENIRYIAFEDGVGGFRPREANDVFVKRFGDCKDISNLITYMLKQAGIPAYLAWVGSRSLPYTYKQVPLLSAANHMIAAVYRDNRWIFLDGTAKNCQYQFPTGFIQGKETMISIGPDSFLVVKVPTIDASKNIDIDSVKLKIESKNLIGQAKSVQKGISRTSFLDQVLYISAHKKDEVMKNYLSLGNNKCIIERHHMEGISFKDSLLRIDYAFTIPDYIRQIDNDTYINMHLNKSFRDLSIDTADNPHREKEFQFCFKTTFAAFLEIPSGFKIRKTPPNLDLKENGYGYTCNFSYKGNILSMTENLIINKLLIEKNETENWNSFAGKIEDYQKKLLVLTPIK